MSVLTLEAKLERTESSTTWGFRLGGGKDFSAPLTIQRVDVGSLAAKCGLEVGDIILRIGNSQTEQLKHKEAKDNIMRCGNRLDLLLQRGGDGGYASFNSPQINTNWNNPAAPPAMSPAMSQAMPPAMSPAAHAPSSAPQNFNNAPRPFGASPAPPRGYEVNLSLQTQNMNMGALAPKAEPAPKADPPAFYSMADKYAEREDTSDPSAHQSKSFKYLQGLMDDGKELPNALKPKNTTSSMPSFNKAQDNSAPVSAPAPMAAPIGQGSKPGTVKALVSQRYNNPLGLYSKDNASTQLEGQSKFLMDNADGAPDIPPPPAPGALAGSGQQENGKKKSWVPSATAQLLEEEKGLKEKEADAAPAHSRTFKMLQQQMGNNRGGAPSPASPAHYGAPAAPAYKPAQSPAYQPSMPSPSPSGSSMSKPWSPAPSVVSNASPRPFGGAPPKPTGQGATRGKRGDAAMSTAASLPSGRIPVCAGCKGPIRGPFVTALGKCWCPDCFICANTQCGCKLLDIGFVEEGGFLYCEKDYATHFAPHCDKCGKAVVGECVNALEKSFCPDCFLCAHCGQPIGGTKFHIEDGKFYCERDWAAMFQTMCAACDFPIEPGDRWVEAMGKNWHSECFNCSTCQVNLEGQQFCAKAGKPYCKKHAR